MRFSSFLPPEKWFLYLKSIDLPSACFIVAAFISFVVPLDIETADVLQDLAWSIFLQSSLILNIASSPSSHTILSVESITPMLTAFLLSALGSFIGGIGAYYVIMNLSLQQKFKGSLKLVTSALTASYIGGTANFFEVINILTRNVATRESFSSIINLVAGIDIGVMVAFFAILHSIRSNARARAWMPRFTNDPYVKKAIVHESGAGQEILSDEEPVQLWRKQATNISWCISHHIIPFLIDSFLIIDKFVGVKHLLYLTIFRMVHPTTSASLGAFIIMDLQDSDDRYGFLSTCKSCVIE